MRVGVAILPEQRWRTAQGRWRRAEALGLDHAWTYDHLAWRSLRDSAWFAAVPTLAAAALATDRIRLGTLVASPNFRHPVPFAKELMSLDDLASGRLIAGIGAGGTGWDASMLGNEAWTAAERSERFAEFVAALDTILSAQASDFEGRHYRAVGARSVPGCVQQPRVPFAIAATGPKGFAVAARYGQMWATTGDLRRDEPLELDDAVRLVRHQLEELAMACESAGRDPGSIDRLVLSGLSIPAPMSSASHFAEALAAFEEAGVTDFVVHWPRESAPYAGSEPAFENVLEAVLPTR